MKEDELLRLACIYAEQDRQAFVEAYASMPNDPAAKKARKFLKALKAYRLKRWGKTTGETILDQASEVTIDQHRKGKK